MRRFNRSWKEAHKASAARVIAANVKAAVKVARRIAARAVAQAALDTNHTAQRIAHEAPVPERSDPRWTVVVQEAMDATDAATRMAQESQQTLVAERAEAARAPPPWEQPPTPQTTEDEDYYGCRTQ